MRFLFLQLGWKTLSDWLTGGFGLMRCFTSLLSVLRRRRRGLLCITCYAVPALPRTSTTERLVTSKAYVIYSSSLYFMLYFYVQSRSRA